jgi:hypothetical protein
VVTPGSVGDWTQALIMLAALAGLAATCGRALWEEERHAPSGRPGPAPHRVRRRLAIASGGRHLE